MLPSQAPLLEFERVSVMRESNLALNDVSLRIGAGEHVAVLGPNGCGKSTLIKAITRECYPLARPESSVRLMGKSNWDVFELRRAMGIVSSDLMTACTRDFTSWDVALSGFFASVGIWSNHHVTDDMRAAAERALERMEVVHLRDRWTDELSSGEARRVLLARALVHEPTALILDEPSTALDLFAQHELRETLRRLAQSGTGLVMVTHHLSDLIPEIERVVLMRGGRIVADGPKQEMLTETRLSELFGLPLTLSERDGYYNLW